MRCVDIGKKEIRNRPRDARHQGVPNMAADVNETATGAGSDGKSVGAELPRQGGAGGGSADVEAIAGGLPAGGSTTVDGDDVGGPADGGVNVGWDEFVDPANQQGQDAVSYQGRSFVDPADPDANVGTDIDGEDVSLDSSTANAVSGGAG
jgi:hypothetical protein